MGHRHHHGERFESEHFERRWERGPRGFGFRGFGPPPWVSPDPRWFGQVPPMWRGWHGWHAPEDFGPPTREERIAMLEEHERRLRRRLERVSEELNRLRQGASERREPGTTI